MNRCGVCNHDLNMEDTLYHRRESDGSVTSYHIPCGVKTKDIKPCEDCGQHRLLCDECRES